MKRILLALVAVVSIAWIGDALARPGGGGSYSGGGGHGGGSGGSSDGGIFQLLYYIIRLCFEEPAFGLPLLGLFIGYVVYSAWKQQQNKDWDSGPPVELKRAVDLDDMHRIDPDFSGVLFEDFAFRLFSTAQRARHSDETIATLAPYFDESARTALRKRPPENVPVQSVVVGAMRLTEIVAPIALVEGRPDRVHISVEFEANVSTVDHTYYSVESWRFSRDAAAKSRPPTASRTFPCPNCGAPWQSSATGTQTCASCGQVVDNGRFDWMVDVIGTGHVDERPPTLLDDVEERGTDLPTVRQDGVDPKIIQLTKDDPQTNLALLINRAEMIYGELNTAWSANDLRPVRGLVSDGLYDYLSYWTEAYKKQGLRNALEDMKMEYCALAKVTRDRYYDAVTLRLFADGLDYTVEEATGKVLKGSKRKKRRYSEYWTLIRSATRRGTPSTEPKCPNCGAALAITQAGECEHCNAHVTSGEFDWVLSKIEQDDSYRG